MAQPIGGGPVEAEVREQKSEGFCFGLCFQDFETITRSFQATDKDTYIDVTALYPPEYWEAKRQGRQIEAAEDHDGDEFDKLGDKYARGKQARTDARKPIKLHSEEATENLNFLTTAQKHLKDKFSTEEEVFETMVHMASVTQGYMLKERFPQSHFLAMFQAFAPQLRYFDANRKKDEWVLDYYIDKEYREELRATQQYTVNDDRGTILFRLIKKVWKGQHDYRHQIMILFHEYDPRTNAARNEKDVKKMELTCQGERDCGIWCRILKMFVTVSKQEHLANSKAAAARKAQNDRGAAMDGADAMEAAAAAVEAPQQAGDEMGFWNDDGDWVDATTGEVTKAEDLNGEWDENGQWVQY